MQISERAARLHRESILIDGHTDILLPVVKGVTTLTESFPDAEMERWRRIAEHQPTRAMGNVPYTLDSLALLTAPAGQNELPLLEAGGVTAQCVAIFMPEEDLDHALETALEMTAALHRAVGANPERCVLATSVADIRAAKAEGKVAYILTFEGAEPIGRRMRLWEIFERLGLRMATLTHSRRNLLADGTQQDINTGGLTSLGRESVKRCAELGIVIDLAHISDQGFWDIIELADGPVLCSHTSVLQPSPGYRAPWDEINTTYGMTKVEAVARTGGLVGVVFWNQPDASTLVDELDAIIEQAGAEHAGLGSDFYGFAMAPADLQHAGQFPNLTEQMVRRGYDDQTIRNVLGENYLRIFEQVWR